MAKKKESKARALKAKEAEEAAEREAVRPLYATDPAESLAALAHRLGSPKEGAATPPLELRCWGAAGAPPALRDALMALLDANMAPVYGKRAWPAARREKAAELEDEQTRLLLVAPPGAAQDSVAGALQYKYVLEDGRKVLYVYELQVADGFRGKGVGKLLMLCAELLARKAGAQGVVLTVQTANTAAKRFYTALKYGLDRTSPQICDPTAADDEYDYEILSKCWA